MRARNIKPGLFKNEVLGTEDPILSLLFIGLWCLADKEGRLEHRPLRIKAEIFPYRPELDINRYLTVMSRLDFIRVYEVAGKEYIEIINFKKHQAPHHTERKSEIPENPNGCDLTVNSPLSNGGNPPDSLIPDSLIQEINTPLPPKPETPPPAPQGESVNKPKREVVNYQPMFEEFWKLYPRKIEKPKAFMVFKAIRPSPETFGAILDGLKRAKDSPDWQREGGRFVPYPERFLKNRRWEDEVQTESREARISEFLKQLETTGGTACQTN